jgi:hypothetical protein
MQTAAKNKPTPRRVTEGVRRANPTPAAKRQIRGASDSPVALRLVGSALQTETASRPIVRPLSSPLTENPPRQLGTSHVANSTAEMADSNSREQKTTEKPAVAESARQPLSQADGPAGGGGSGAALLGQIAGAPPSPLQPIVLSQAERIRQDCAVSESQVTRVAMTRRQQISSSFAGARAGLSGFFTQSIASAQAFIAKRQADITASATSAITSIRTAISGALQSARAQVAQVRARINQTLERIKSSTQTAVDGVAKRITRTIDSVPFPNIPGVGRIRSAAAGLLNRAAGVVNGAFGRLTGFVGWVLNAGLGILDSLLRIVSNLVDRALALVLAAIQRVIQIVGQGLSRIVEVIGSTLRRILLAICLPILSRIERLIQMAIDRGRQHALATLRRNRDQYLAAMAAALLPSPGGSGPCPENPIPMLLQLGRDAIQNNRLIVQTFQSITGRIFAAIIGAIVSGVARTLAFIARSVSQAFQAIANALRPAIQWLTETVQAVGRFVRELMQGFTGKLANVAEYLRSLVQGGAERLLQFGLDGLRRIGSFIYGYVRRLITGGSGGATDVMGEFTVAHSLGGGGSRFAFLGPTPAFAGSPIFIIGGTLFIIIGAVAIILPVWLAIVIAVAVILLLILIIYLIWRWLSKPKTPKPCCTIVTKTLVSAPDGTADTRSAVGVNERVEMTAGTSSNWSASHGSVSPATGPSTIWTAPARKASSCTITAKPTAGASPCSVTMKAIEPTESRQTIKSRLTYTAGLAGSGFIGDCVIHPLNVSFSRIKTREDIATGKATGYYDTVLGWNGSVHPAGSLAPIDTDNRGVPDTVGTVPPGSPKPFDKGKFHWPIPQLFQVLGGSGETKFSVSDHVQEMSGTSGEETTSKEGASRTRTP